MTKAEKKAKGIVACDVGNSRIALGCVVDEKVTHVHRLGPDDPDALAEALAEVWQQAPAPRRVVASSVNPTGMAALVSAAGRLGEDVLRIGQEVALPIETRLEHPERVGTDRLCVAAMAYHRMGQACVVADFGTAVTVDCVDAEGVFLGGAILPGLELGARSLAGRTAHLPRVEPSDPDWVFGQDTEQAIIGGLVYGARGALRQLTEAYATELGQWPLLILTGGDAELVAAGSDLVDVVVPDLALTGIALAYYLDIARES